ncbi:DEAD/DEAH box helicase [Methanobrevibacter sp. DSM 116169]|uniref:DEAD/DEAH box helicase n=1 Tax=Methanobrevibacter sp. DSM 116169 TaxID=3242727 RepID=UPI0038FD30D8
MTNSKIDKFKNDIRFKDKIAYVKTIPSKKAKYKKINNLNEKLLEYLSKHEIKLYSHQTDTCDEVKDGNNVILTTPTASGKTLAFNLPIFDTLMDDEDACALYIYPAKALSYDQLDVLKKLEDELDLNVNPESYDGDTDKSRRYEIRQKSRIILTNPYQLHHILGWHHQWKRFYSNLKYIVIDEAHYYKGIFGSNVSFLIRRLKRIANFYGSNPQFILSSATLANPLELANKLTDEEFTLIDEDTSPSGEKDFILYNPFKNYRRTKVNSANAPSIHQETEQIFLYLILKDIQTLCFTVSRKIAELIAMWAKRDMKQIKGKLAHRITAYRAGYLAKERREIEEGLKTRKLLGVTCTNALELGINIGSLDAVIISGYPGTMISTWQQGGRAGRGMQKSLVILIAFENQLDQYFMNNPDFFFDKPHENAIIDTNNSIIKKAHILCAANELPLTSEDAFKYFKADESLLDNLMKSKDLAKNLKNQYLYPYDDNPSFTHSLDQLSSDFFKIMNNNQLLETMERGQMYREAHEGAVLINKGETFIVNNVNLAKGFVNVSKQAVDYHTTVLKDVDIKILEKINKKKIGNLSIHFGALEVSEDYYKYKKIQFSKTIGTFFLDLPPLKFETKGIWFTIPEDVKKYLEKEYDEDDIFAGGLHGVEHAIIGLFPLHVMCDRFDIGGLSINYHQDTQEATIFIYDAYEEGIGISEKAIDVFSDILKSTKHLLENCNCKYGCPSCIYSPKCGNDNKPLNKKATEYILNYMCEEVSKKTEKIDKEPKNISQNTIIEDPDEMYDEALELFNAKDYLNAKDILVEIIAIDKRYINAWTLLASILNYQDDINGAMNFIKKALSIDSSNEEANELYIELKNKI